MERNHNLHFKQSASGTRRTQCGWTVTAKKQIILMMWWTVFASAIAWVCGGARETASFLLAGGCHTSCQPISRQSKNFCFRRIRQSKAHSKIVVRATAAHTFLRRTQAPRSTRRCAEGSMQQLVKMLHQHCMAAFSIPLRTTIVHTAKKYISASPLGETPARSHEQYSAPGICDSAPAAVRDIPATSGAKRLSKKEKKRERQRRAVSARKICWLAQSVASLADAEPYERGGGAVDREQRARLGKAGELADWLVVEVVLLAPAGVVE